MSGPGEWSTGERPTGSAGDVAHGSFAEQRPTGSSPLRRVLDAVRTGVHGREALCRSARVDEQMLDAALAQLERMGVLERESVGSACPTGGCGSCPVTGGCAGTPGRGPVLLTLRRRDGDRLA